MGATAGGDDPTAGRHRHIVAQGYDAIGRRYLEGIAETRGDPRLPFLDALAGRLCDGAVVLELGCGAGVPCTRRLAERFRVIGVDLSERQLRMARERLGGVPLVRSDMAEIAFRAGSFDAATAFYSVTHVPRRRHAELFASIARWLRPGGWFLASLGAGDVDDGVEEDWLGAPMFFSHFDADTNRRLLTDAGFRLVVAEEVTVREPDGDATFLWVLAQQRGRLPCKTHRRRPT